MINYPRDEINEGIKTALGQLDGSDTAAISLLTGLTTDELDDLGGVSENTGKAH